MHSPSGEPNTSSPIVNADDPPWLASTLNDSPGLSIHLTARLDEIRSRSLRDNEDRQVNPYPHHILPSSGRLIAMLHRYGKLHENAAENEPKSSVQKASETRKASVWRLVSAIWGSPSNPETISGGASYFLSLIHI